MIIDTGKKFDFCDVLIRPKRSNLGSRKEMSLYREFTTRWSERTFSCVPIIASNMATGTFAMAEVFAKYAMLVAIHKFHSEKQWLDASSDAIRASIYTIGKSKEEYETFKKVRSSLVNAKKLMAEEDLFLCIDIANGYSQNFADFVKEVRKENPKTVIIAGNVCTPEMVQELVLSGADIIKIGIGPGSECTTRLKTGIGYPQLSAGVECSDAAHGLNAQIILDGGIRTPGDAAKAFVTCSDFIMLGGMLSGTDEQEGEIITRRYLTNEIDKKDKQIIVEKKFKLFYGMSSEYAQSKFSYGMKEYRTSEGRVEEVPYKGKVEDIILDLFGGLRSCGTYIGAHCIRNFGKCGTFVQVSRQHDRF